MEEKTLIKGGTVLSLDPKVGNFSKADVLFEGTKILEVGTDLNSKGAKELDADGMVVMPGFVDSHRHMWLGLLRNAGTDSLAKDLQQQNGNQENLAKRFRPKDVFAGTLSSALGALDAGITTILNYSNIGFSGEHTKADLDAIRQSGIRAVFATGPDSFDKADETGLSAFKGFVENNGAYAGNLVSLALASLGPEYKPVDYLKREWALARELHLRITTQVGMGGHGQADGIARTAKAGLLGSDVLYAHCNTLTENDLRLIRDHKGQISISPAAEMMLGYGEPTIQRMLDLNLRPSLGVDSEGVARGDLFTQMRSAISMQHAMSFEKKLAHRLSPNQITTRDVLEFATTAGANAVGLGERVGTLTPGKEADIVLLRQFQINVMPVNDPIGAVVWAMDTSNVDTVIVGGTAMKRGGELLNVDLGELRKITAEARDHLFATA
jgi:5-methylthioadenosine/S-adenosylhomocysteine deaminase